MGNFTLKSIFFFIIVYKMEVDQTLLVLTSDGKSDSSDFRTGLNVPFRVDGDEYFEIAVDKVSLWYSWYNISTKRGNNKFVYNNGVEDVTITIDDGNYSIGGLNAFIHSRMKANGDYNSASTPESYYITIVPNINTNRVYAEVVGGYTMKFTDGTLYKLMGWNEDDEITASGDAPNIADFLNGLSSVLIRCDIVDGYASVLDGVASDVITSFFPQSAPSSHIEIIPRNLLFLRVNQTYVSSIRMYITDQKGDPIDFNGEPITYFLRLRRSRPGLSAEPNYY